MAYASSYLDFIGSNLVRGCISIENNIIRADTQVCPYIVTPLRVSYQ